MISELVKIISKSQPSAMPLVTSNAEETETELPDINIRRRYVRKGRNKRQFLDTSMSQTGSEDDNESSSPPRKPLKQGATASRQAVSSMSADTSKTPSEKRAP